MHTVAGIDIGSEAIKAVVLGCAKNGPVEIMAAGTLALGELGHLEDGADKNLAIGAKLKELVKTSRIRAATRRIGVSGKDTSIRYLQVPPVPAWRLDMLVKYEISEKSGDKELSAYDYRTLDVPEVSGQDTIMIGAIKEAAAVELMARAKSAKLGEVELDLEAVALYNAYYHGHGFDADKTALVVDIGADDLTILICRNGSLFFARTIMGGGRRFSQALADELKIDLLEADEIKKTQAQISFDIPSSGNTGRLARGGAGARSGARPGLGQSDPNNQSGIIAFPTTTSDVAASDTPNAEVKSNGDVSTPLTLPQPPSSADATSASQTSAATASAPQASSPPSTMDTAQTALINQTAVAMDANDEKRKRQMSGALVREAAGLCAALENAALVCKTQTKLRDLKFDCIYVTGGGSKLKGLIEFISRRMRLEALPLEPLRKLSLKRFPADQAAALKANQHALAVAIGLAISRLQKGTFSFLLWPLALKERKMFWARDAYIYYAAALIAITFVLCFYMPYRNCSALKANDDLAQEAITQAKQETKTLEELIKKNKYQYKQLEQIQANIDSGRYFLNVLAELKNKARISDDIYITAISTSMPTIVKIAGGQESEKIAEVKPDAASSELETFQTQRRVYLRGFARGDKAQLLEKIEKFWNALVPYPKEPDHKDNLFKKIGLLWFSPEDHQQGPFFLKEFVLEAYAESTKDMQNKN